VVGHAQPVRSKSAAMSEKTVLMIHSLEDSLAHWCTLSMYDAIQHAEVHE
jgi:hypothetical protein